MYYTFNGARRNVPGIEWLATPKLPQGSTVESVRWMAGGSIIYFEGNVSGSFQILDPKEYRHIIKACILEHISRIGRLHFAKRKPLCRERRDFGKNAQNARFLHALTSE